MKRLHLLAILLLTATAMAAPPEETTARVRMAQWLTAQTGQAILPVELLMYPKTGDLSRCQVTGLRGVGAHRSELRLHCPGMALPQLVVKRKKDRLTKKAKRQARRMDDYDPEL